MCSNNKDRKTKIINSGNWKHFVSRQLLRITDWTFRIWTWTDAANLSDAPWGRTRTVGSPEQPVEVISVGWRDGEKTFSRNSFKKIFNIIIAPRSQSFPYAVATSDTIVFLTVPIEMTCFIFISFRRFDCGGLDLDGVADEVNAAAADGRRRRFYLETDDYVSAAETRNRRVY